VAIFITQQLTSNVLSGWYAQGYNVMGIWHGAHHLQGPEGLSLPPSPPGVQWHRFVIKCPKHKVQDKILGLTPGSFKPLQSGKLGAENGAWNALWEEPSPGREVGGSVQIGASALWRSESAWLTAEFITPGELSFSAPVKSKKIITGSGQRHTQDPVGILLKASSLKTKQQQQQQKLTKEPLLCHLSETSDLCTHECHSIQSLPPHHGLPALDLPQLTQP
jgi:hypothetical protein